MYTPLAWNLYTATTLLCVFIIFAWIFWLRLLFLFLACGDYSWLSCMRARPNYCSTSMKKECPRSCGVCSGPESESCANLPNKLGDNYCVDRSNRGGCRDTNFRRRYDMKTGCTKVCCQRTELNTYSGRWNGVKCMLFFADILSWFLQPLHDLVLLRGFSKWRLFAKIKLKTDLVFFNNIALAK